MHGDARVSGFLAQGDAGQEGDALAVGDEFHDGRERGRCEGADPGGIVQLAGGNGLVAEAMSLVEQEDALGGNAGERNGWGRIILDAGCEHESIFEQGLADEARAMPGCLGTDQGDVQRPIHKAADERVGAVFADGEIEARQLAGKGGEYLGQQVGRDSRDQPEADRPVRFPGMSERKGGQRVGAVEDDPSAADEFGAKRSGADTGLEPIEQCRAAGDLDGLDLLAKRRLTDIAQPRGAAEMPRLSHGNGVAHLLE